MSDLVQNTDITSPGFGGIHENREQREAAARPVSGDPLDKLRKELGTPYETVDHPRHYNSHPAGIECIDVIEHMTFNTGSAVKYAWRAGLKPGADVIEDLEKARWYTDREIARLRRQQDDL